MSEIEHTTITVKDETKERLNEYRDGKPWDAYMNELLNKGVVETVPVEDALAELREHGSGSATDIDPGELAERVSSKVVADLRDMQS